jgi:murein DD-endopeptidase MepM/ murein hydrolase activator NlpD
MPNTHVGARFAENRSYMFEGRVVDTQTHLGYDLASNAASPVPAANDGVVAFADNLGIYGQTVILDHGMGLFSLYGHLSEIGVETGKPISKGDPVGRSGQTGLAGGDHLHYSMMLAGVFVDPLEWFDEKWIREHLEAKLSPPPAEP